MRLRQGSRRQTPWRCGAVMLALAAIALPSAAWVEAEQDQQASSGSATLPSEEPGDTSTLTQIMARVGDQPIRRGDVMPVVEEIMSAALARMSVEQIAASRNHIEEQRQKLLLHALNRAVEAKLLYVGFLRSLSADERRERLPNIIGRADEQFRKTELPQAMDKAKASTESEYDTALRRYGSSLDEQQRLYAERMLGQSALFRSVDFQPEITPEEILAYSRRQTGAVARGDAGSVPVGETPLNAEESKEIIRSQKVRQQIAEHLRRLRSEIPVWTAFDEAAAKTGAKAQPSPDAAPQD